jgi:thioesterase-3
LPKPHVTRRHPRWFVRTRLHWTGRCRVCHGAVNANQKEIGAPARSLAPSTSPTSRVLDYIVDMNTQPASGAIGPVHEFPLVIHEGHLDTFGHVNNATYLQLFEQARWDWITQGGYGLSKIQETKQGPVILDCAVQFRREVTNRQAVRIRTWIATLGTKVATVRQDVAVERAQLDVTAPSRSEVCCSATFTMAFFDLAARRIIEPSDAWLGAFGLRREDVQR